MYIRSDAWTKNRKFLMCSGCLRVGCNTVHRHKMLVINLGKVGRARNL